MGNYTSCFVSSNDVNSSQAKLVDSHGQVRLVDLPTTAAEIMLEYPGFAVSHVDVKLIQTRRVPVMKAEDLLLGRKVYLLVPVDKVNAMLSDLQLDALETVVCPRRTKGGSSRVSPVGETGGDDVEDLVKSLSEKCSGLTGQKKRVIKDWEPVLEPILETC